MAQFFEQQPWVHGKFACQEQDQRHGCQRAKHLRKIVERQAFFKPDAQAGNAKGQARKGRGNSAKEIANTLQHGTILGYGLLACLPRIVH